MSTSGRTLANFKAWFVGNSHRFQVLHGSIRETASPCRCPLEVWFGYGKHSWQSTIRGMEGQSAYVVMNAADYKEPATYDSRRLRDFMLECIDGRPALQVQEKPAVPTSAQ